MITQTQEQGRESLEELAKQAIETPEEARAQIPPEQHKKGTLREHDYDWKVKMHMGFHSRFYELVQSMANPEYDGKLSYQQRENFLKLLRLRKSKGVDLAERALFAQQKLRYYDDLANNKCLANVPQIAESEDQWSFGGVGKGFEFSYRVYFGDNGLHYLKRGDYVSLVAKAKKELPELWARLEGNIKTSLERMSNESPNLYTSYKIQWNLTGYRNAFRVFAGYANDLVRARKLKENDWKVLCSIQEDATKKCLERNETK